MYLNDWAGKGLIDLIGDFEGVYISGADYAAEKAPYSNVGYWLENKQKMTDALVDPKWQNLDILLASYGYENYSGDAFVLFKRDGKLYEVNGGHCSCYGLEGLWEPEETTVEALRHRLEAGSLGSYEHSGNVFATELRGVLDSLDAENLA